ncbi:MAG: type II toxin-antitoxin system RelE/ParE family toxin [Sedimentisphaerales bacterium]|nr:type II toxin-antitoxin system RelE/ParE family toxin [Sedimentisphaerales bacterium]
MYIVRLKSKAQKFIERQSKKIQKRLIKHIENLATNPRPSNSKLLHSKKQVYRIHSGNYRIVYQIQERKLLVIIAKAGDRKDIYKNRKKWLQAFPVPNTTP